MKLMRKHFQHKKFLLHFLIIIFFCLLPLPVLYRWFQGNTIFYFWDTTFPLKPSLGLLHFFYLWKANSFPGFFDTGWSWLPYIGVLFILESTFHSLSLTQAFLYWGLLLASSITFYFLITYVFGLFELKQRVFTIVAAILGAGVYTYNIYVYYYSFRIFNPQEFIIALLPLNFLALLRLYPMENDGLRGKKFLFWLLVFFLSLFGMTSGFSTLVYYIQYVGGIGFYLLVQIFYKRKWSFRQLLNRCVFMILIFLFNLWWFFPMYLGLQDVYMKASQIGTGIYFNLNSQLSYLLNVLRLIGLPPMQNPLFSWENLYVHNQFFTFPLFIFPFFILLLGAWLHKLSKQGLILFLFTIFSILLFIVKEANPPFSFILEFAFNHVPFFGVFRDAYQKAGLFYMFVYFLLFSLSLGITYQQISWRKKYTGSIIIFFALIASVIMTAPFLIFQNIPFLLDESHTPPITYSAKIKIPQEYYALQGVLDPICKTGAVLVIPRTSILSSAYWKETNYSYVGEDIMSNLINCNMISTQILNNTADAYYTVPYLFLKQNNSEGLKKFMEQSNIQFLLVRHDYISNAFTDYAFVDPAEVSRNVNKDKDFTRIYHNSLFDVYRYKDKRSSSYGITFPTTSLYTNADFTSAKDIQLVFSGLPSQSMFITSDPQFPDSQQQKFIFANCIGCEYLPGTTYSESAVNQSDSSSLLQLLKNILHRRAGGITLDSKLAAMETAFQTWLGSGTSHDAQLYITDVNTVMERYRLSLSGDFFTDDYAKIKVRNYLVNEHNVLVQNRKKYRYLSNEAAIENLQQTDSMQIANTIWETDFQAKKQRYRLDIPQTQEYICQTSSDNNAIAIQKFLIDGKTAQRTPLLLTKGSHKAEITYATKAIFSQSSLSVPASKTSAVKIPLSGFVAGSYYMITMHTATASARTMGNIRILILNRNVSLHTAEELANQQNGNFIYNNTMSVKRLAAGVSDYFYTSNNPYDSYYLYIIADRHSNKGELTFSQFEIMPIPTKDTLVPYCTNSKQAVLPTIHFTVLRKDPTQYILTIAHNQQVQKRIVVFNQTYHPFWTAYTFINGRKHIYKHALQAGYANAWYIDTVGDGKIYLSFTPQQETEIVAVISIVLFLLCLVIFIFLQDRKTPEL